MEISQIQESLTQYIEKKFDFDRCTSIISAPTHLQSFKIALKKFEDALKAEQPNNDEWQQKGWQQKFNKLFSLLFNKKQNQRMDQDPDINCSLERLLVYERDLSPQFYTLFKDDTLPLNPDLEYRSRGERQISPIYPKINPPQILPEIDSELFPYRSHITDMIKSLHAYDFVAHPPQAIAHIKVLVAHKHNYGKPGISYMLPPVEIRHNDRQKPLSCYEFLAYMGSESPDKKILMTKTYFLEDAKSFSLAEHLERLQEALNLRFQEAEKDLPAARNKYDIALKKVLELLPPTKAELADLLLSLSEKNNYFSSQLKQIIKKQKLYETGALKKVATAGNEH